MSGKFKDLKDEEFEKAIEGMRKPTAIDVGAVSHLASAFDQEIAIIANLLLVTPAEIMELDAAKLFYVRGKFQLLATYIPTSKR